MSHADESADLAPDVLRDAFGRVRESVSSVLDRLSPDELLWRPDPEANHIAWLVWHLARVQDDHVAGVGEREQIWIADGWQARFGLPYPERAHGYGQSAGEVGAFPPTEPALLDGYHAAVHAQTVEIIDAMTPADFTRIVDSRWDPPVTAAVRLVSVLDDTMQHAGQAAYVRGLIERRP